MHRVQRHHLFEDRRSNWITQPSATTGQLRYFNQIPLWSQGAVPEPGTDIMTFPFVFTLPTNLPPAFHCSATSRSATIGYSLEVVGERSGFHRMNRRIRRLISVVPQSQLLVKETLTQGWNGPWREIAQEEKLRQGLWGNYSHASIKAS
ncbi:hypothetical protein B0H16DRAFT_1850100, partial [Mycena metata]